MVNGQDTIAHLSSFELHGFVFIDVSVPSQFGTATTCSTWHRSRHVCLTARSGTRHSLSRWNRWTRCWAGSAWSVRSRRHSWTRHRLGLQLPCLPPSSVNWHRRHCVTRPDINHCAGLPVFGKNMESGKSRNWKMVWESLGLVFKITKSGKSQRICVVQENCPDIVQSSYFLTHFTDLV